MGILDHLRADERRPDVWLVVVPEIVFRYARPTVAGPKEAVRSKLMSERTAARILRDGALFPDMTEEAETYLFARNFHHQLKAQLLHKEVVLQVVRETTSIQCSNSTGSAIPPLLAGTRADRVEFLDHNLLQGARVQPWQLADVRRECVTSDWCSSAICLQRQQ